MIPVAGQMSIPAATTQATAEQLLTAPSQRGRSLIGFINQDDFADQIERFYGYIDEATLRNDVERSAEQKRQHFEKYISLADFRDALYEIFGDDIKLKNIKAVHQKLLANPEADIAWNEVFGYDDRADSTAEAAAAALSDLGRGERPIDDDKVFVTRLRRCVADGAGSATKRRDIIKHINYIPHFDVYATVSQGGLIQVLARPKRTAVSENVMPQNDMFARKNFYAVANSLQSHSGDRLSTCSVYLPNLRRIVVASDKTICVWDHRSPTRESYVIGNFPAPIICMAVIQPLKSRVVQADSDGKKVDEAAGDAADSGASSSPSGSGAIFEDSIMFGDTEGCIGIVRIFQKDLAVKAQKKPPPGTSGGSSASSDQASSSVGDSSGRSVELQHSIDIKNLQTPIFRRKVHNDWTMRLIYIPETNSFASCSADEHLSFVCDSISHLRRESRQLGPFVAVERGVNVFAMSLKINIVVTGGADRILRIWHPGIWSKPAGRLVGSIFSVVDVAINEDDQHVISLSAARIIRVWDVHTLQQLQVFADNENRPGERRIHCLLYNPIHEILLTGSSVIDEWPLARKYRATMVIPRSHPAAVVSSAINETLGQLVTTDTTPQIRIWDLETGRLLIQAEAGHGNEVEISAIGFSGNGYRMATGGMNGSLRIWDFGCVEIVKRYETDLPSSSKMILDIVFIPTPNVTEDPSTTLRRSRSTMAAGSKNEQGPPDLPIPINYVLALGWGGKLRIYRDSPHDPELIFLCDFSDPAWQLNDRLFASPEPGSAAPLNDAPVQTVMEPMSRDSTALANLARSASAGIDELVRMGYNQCLHLLPAGEEPIEGRARRQTNNRKQGPCIITGTTFGHLIAWDMVTMDYEIKWRIPQPIHVGGATSVETDDSDPAVIARLPSSLTVVSNTSMVSLPTAELSRVNALVLVRVRFWPKKRGKVVEQRPADSPGFSEPEDAKPDDTEAGEEGESESEEDSSEENDDGGMDYAATQAMQTIAQFAAAVGNEPIIVGQGPPLLFSEARLLISAHQDTWLRVWTVDANLGSQLLVLRGSNNLHQQHSDGESRATTSMTANRRPSAIPPLSQSAGRIIHAAQMELVTNSGPISCLCTDAEDKLIAAGDYRGYVCAWSLELELTAAAKKAAQIAASQAQAGHRQPLTPVAPKFGLKMKVSWRAHTMKVEDILYYKPTDLLLTSSMDRSVRIWQGFSAKYLGFLGQPTPIIHAGSFTYGPMTTPALPDITEPPLQPVGSERQRQRRLKNARSNCDVPLYLDRGHWDVRKGIPSGDIHAGEPAYVDPKHRRRYWHPKVVNEKYFHFLRKPKLPDQGDKAPGKDGEAVKLTDIYRSLRTHNVDDMSQATLNKPDFSVLGNETDFMSM